MNWNQIVNKVKPYIVKRETPTGSSGTGFLCLYNEAKSWCGIATASHVVDYADEWQQPVKIIHQSKDTFFLKEADRVIILDRKTDSAMILFSKPTRSSLPEDLIPI